MPAHIEVADFAPDEVGAKRSNDGFDFWEFGHARALHYITSGDDGSIGRYIRHTLYFGDSHTPR